MNELQRQASQIEGLSYEIVVADDGSTDTEAMAANEAINLLPHCRYIVRKENVGRAAIRNFLASIAAYDWLLFIDSGMSIGNDEFLKRYLETEAADGSSSRGAAGTEGPKERKEKVKRERTACSRQSGGPFYVSML